MRKLSEQELEQVKKAIASKELTSVEILVEIYDHYMSHLEDFQRSEFEDELGKLEVRFTSGYCHALQAKLNKEIRKDVGKLHWKIIQRNFHLPRIMNIIGFMSVAFYLSSSIGNGKEAAIMMIFPLLILKIFHLYLLARSSIRIKIIKRSVNQKSHLQSSLFYPISERMYLPVIVVYSIVWFSDMMFDIQVSSNIAPQIALIFSILLFIYVISVLEIWKIKSKTSLI
ncbi:hypothetical protein [Algoriphagus aquimarinus]|uniref:Uncharacterized protein n=1 Tax=Algoriphagus aquimarinus TaxID=237018 RepID=A0A5C7AC96_9BACT|nr:hypothetical protein [Algoriphagus aquimarinus]TXE04036.1 hypothetical protein ESV85_19295 [Algoriphagus aquimarinus]